MARRNIQITKKTEIKASADFDAWSLIKKVQSHKFQRIGIETNWG
jgi:hypothetical protein